MGIIKRLTQSMRRSDPPEPEPERKKYKKHEITKRFNTTLQMMAATADEAAARALEESENIKDESAKITRTLSGAPVEPKHLQEA